MLEQERRLRLFYMLGNFSKCYNPFFGSKETIHGPMSIAYIKILEVI